MWNSLVFARQPAEQILYIFWRRPASCRRQLMSGKRATEKLEMELDLRVNSFQVQLSGAAGREKIADLEFAVARCSPAFLHFYLRSSPSKMFDSS